ncbi:MAG: hypothetical protein V2A65_00250 [Candidatus Omnitrophota bacterium]
MSSPKFLSIPENRKRFALILVAVIILFFFILIIRSCRRPEKANTKDYLLKLSSPVPEVRLDGALGLERLGVKSAVPEIEKVFLNDSDERVRRAAAYAILVLDQEKFLSFLKSPTEEVKIIALETLARKDKEKAYSYLEQALLDPSLSIRRKGLSLLIQVSAKEAVGPALCLAEKSGEDTPLRIEALEFLGREAGPEILPRLKPVFTGWAEDQAVRRSAGDAIDAIKKREEESKKSPVSQ